MLRAPRSAPRKKPVETRARVADEITKAAAPRITAMVRFCNFAQNSVLDVLAEAVVVASALSFGEMSDYVAVQVTRDRRANEHIDVRHHGATSNNALSISMQPLLFEAFYTFGFVHPSDNDRALLAVLSKDGDDCECDATLAFVRLFVCAEPSWHAQLPTTRERC